MQSVHENVIVVCVITVYANWILCLEKGMSHWLQTLQERQMSQWLDTWAHLSVF